MKKILLLAMLLTTGSSYAAHGPAGCGLGKLLFEGKEGLIFNVLAATFNGSSGSQTFGMSTGTLGCEDAKEAKVSAVSFIEANMIALSNDIARGNGETLTAYLKIVKKENANTMILKKNFGDIFAQGRTPAKIHQKIVSYL